MIQKPVRFAFLVFLLAGMAGCATTGDPRQGGLFGWSETKAKQRISDRQSHLSQIEADTDRVERQNRQLQGQ